MTEASKNEEYYSVLNLQPSATQEQIQTAYRRLALAYHPDRHTDAHLQDLARTRFAQLQEVYEVLSDPQKRRLYDTLGVEGLKSGLEVSAHFRTPEALKAEFERLAAKQAMREIERKVPIRTQVEAKFALRRGIFPFLRSLSSSFVFQGTMGGGSVSVGGAVLAQGPRGVHNLTLSYNKSTESGQLQVTTVLGNRFAFITVLTKQLTEHMSGIVSLRMGSTRNVTTSLTREVGKGKFFRIGYCIGQEGGLKLRYSHVALDGGVVMSTTARIGNDEYECNAKAEYKVSERASVFATVRAGEQKALEAGVSRQISKYSSLHCLTSIGDAGVTVTLRWVRLGQSLSLPFIVSEDFSVTTAVAGVMAPILLAGLVHFLVLKPAETKKKERKLQEMKDEKAESVVSAKNAAEQDLELMKAAVARKLASEEARNGLIILKALYGTFSSNVGEYGTQPTDSIVDVTIPLQFLVESSQLQLFSASKHALPGFYDVAVGEEKKLYVLYRFKGKLHEVIVGNEEPLTIPVKRDLLPESARRVW